jgi:hypothetical protein
VTASSKAEKSWFSVLGASDFSQTTIPTDNVAYG